MEKSNNEFLSASGIPIKRVYTPEDTKGIEYDREIGLPGEYPFTRGVYHDMYRGKLWTIRRYSGVNTPEDTNKLYKKEYEIGQTGFSMAVDGPTNSGLDSDDPRVSAEVGAVGVPIDSLLDMEICFDDLPIDRISTSVTTSTMSCGVITAMYFAVAEKRGLDLKKLYGSTANDVTSCPGSVFFYDQVAPSVQLRIAVDIIEWCLEVAPKWHPVFFDSYNYREHSITAVQETGLLLATALAYVEEEKRRGRVPLDEFIRVLAFNMSSHNDFFEEIAKFRAARRMWAKIVRERYGIDDPNLARFRFHVQSAGITHTTQEPLNNLIRVAYQVLAAALGGAQSVHANGYDEGMCLPTEEGMLLSIRTEQILQHETNVINTVDPLGGSYFIESLTTEIEKQANEYIRKIEDLDGVIIAQETGWLHEEYSKAMMDHQLKVDSGKEVVVGVNKFRLDEELYKVPIFKPDPDSDKVQIKRLEKLRKERDNEKVDKLLKELKEVTISGENMMPVVFEAVKAYASLGEIASVWREVHSIWKYPINL